MATYRVTTTTAAARALFKIKRRDRDRVTAAIRGLGTDPRPAGCFALQGRTGYRIRVGDYRVIHLVDDDEHVIEVRKVGHRRDVYER